MLALTAPLPLLRFCFSAFASQLLLVRFCFSAFYFFIPRSLLHCSPSRADAIRRASAPLSVECR
ncbi:hypothetical protein, partial [Paraburkholderia sp. SIMBA_054]|uniref:hypothetical protein n=1 Tax=Paraburkholderia sp. SIMBA_054 TaxID=3085795 RepID=UPI00397C0744